VPRGPSTRLAAFQALLDGGLLAAGGGAAEAIDAAAEPPRVVGVPRRADPRLHDRGTLG
jgi:hypothetical protein